MRKTNGAVRVKASIKAGSSLNHNRRMAGTKVKAGIKAGGSTVNHSRALAEAKASG